MILFITINFSNATKTCDIVNHNYPHFVDGSIYLGFKLWGKPEQCCQDCMNTPDCDYILYHVKVCLKYQYFGNTTFSDVQLKPFAGYYAGFVKK